MALNIYCLVKISFEMKKVIYLYIKIIGGNFFNFSIRVIPMSTEDRQAFVPASKTSFFVLRYTTFVIFYNLMIG